MGQVGNLGCALRMQALFFYRNGGRQGMEPGFSRAGQRLVRGLRDPRPT